jgi:predicted GTPase
LPNANPQSFPQITIKIQLININSLSSTTAMFSSRLSLSPVAKRGIFPCAIRIPNIAASLTQRFASSADSDRDNVIILGAAGRDFHDFMTYWSTKPNTTVKCFTGAQIPGIDHRVFPPEMCNNDKNNNLYPDGVTIFPESQLEDLIERKQATTCALAYSDLKYDTVQSLASRANAAGCEFIQLAPMQTMIPSSKPVVSICASRTGVGKSQTTRYVADYYKQKGLKVAVIRHPMPYDNVLLDQRCQRYEKLEDMDKYNCTIEEREEYYRHIEDGNLLFAGVDYLMILREAEKEADVIIWDGGNNDVPFYKPDLHICLVDGLRPHDEERYYPGETNVRMADMVMITKVSDLPDIQQAFDQATHLKSITKPNAPIFFGTSVITPEGKDFETGEPLTTEEATALVKGKRVLVVDDGPTLTHGGMPYGVGYVLAKNLGADQIVDPRPFAKGSLVSTYEKFPHLKSVLPAMGYGDEQVRDLESTIQATECDTVILGTPSDISHVMDIGKPVVVARYNLAVVPEHCEDFDKALDSFYDRFRRTNHHAA